VHFNKESAFELLDIIIPCRGLSKKKTFSGQNCPGLQTYECARRKTARFRWLRVFGRLLSSPCFDSNWTEWRCDCQGSAMNVLLHCCRASVHIPARYGWSFAGSVKAKEKINVRHYWACASQLSVKPLMYDSHRVLIGVYQKISKNFFERLRVQTFDLKTVPPTLSVLLTMLWWPQ